MYNLIGYSDNYTDTSGSLWQLKRDEVSANNSNLTVNNSQSFKCKAALIGKRTTNHNNGKFSAKDTKIVVPSKYLSNFWRSLDHLVLETLKNLR